MDAYSVKKTGIDADLQYVIGVACTYMAAKMAS